VPMPRHSRQSATVGGLRGWKVRTANDTLAAVWCLFKNRTQDAALFDLTGGGDGASCTRAPTVQPFTFSSQSVPIVGWPECFSRYGCSDEVKRGQGAFR
jgi:hypothetical protein